MLYFSPHQTKKQVRKLTTFSLKIRLLVWVIYCMFRAGENRFFFLSLRILFSFRALGFFTFSLSFRASKTLYVWGLISGPDSSCRYLGGGRGKKGKKKFPKLIFGYSCTASSIWMFMNSWHVDSSPEQVNYQPVCRLEILAPYEVEGGSGIEERGRAREREERRINRDKETETEARTVPNVSESRGPCCETIKLESSHLWISIWASSNATCRLTAVPPEEGSPSN